MVLRSVDTLPFKLKKPRYSVHDRTCPFKALVEEQMQLKYFERCVRLFI